MADQDDDQLSTLQQLFLQAIISRRVLTDSDAIACWKRCSTLLQEPYEPREMSNALQEINTVLENLGFAIRRGTDPVTKKPYIVFTNTRSDEIAQFATDYTAPEIAYFRGIIEDIIGASDLKYCISHKEALQAAGNLTPVIKKPAAQTLLHSFVDKGWLAKSAKGNYSLSLRALNELETYLREEFEDDLGECVICQEFVTVGIECPVANCSCRMHSFCLVDHRKKSGRCPSCTTVWPQNNSGLTRIGEPEASKDNRNGATGFAVASDNDVGEEDDEEEESERPRATKKTAKASRASQSRRRPTRGATRMEEDEESDELETQ